MLKINDLNIAFNNKTIFKDASMEIPNSSIVAITGDSGTGKTTLLRFILGEAKNAKGILIYDNQIIEDRDDFIFNEVSYIDQEGRYFENMSVQDYFEFECRIHHISFSKEEMIKCLKQVQLNNITYSKSPKLLSTGERKRFLMAAALMIKKNILLIDEPTASLDDHHKRILLDILHELSHQGMTVIVTTHDDDVLKESDLIYEIHDYKLIQKTSKEIIESPIQKKTMKPRSINYVKYKSFKLILLFIICISLGGASIGLISQNTSTLIALNNTTQVNKVSKNTALFFIKKLDPRYIVENSNVFDIQQEYEGINYVSEDELTAIKNIKGVKNIYPCIDVRKADQMTPFGLYQKDNFVQQVTTLANITQSYNRNIYLTVYYPEEHIKHNGKDIKGIYMNDVMYNMLDSQVKSLKSLKQLSMRLDVNWVDNYQTSTTEENMPEMTPITTRKDITVPIDVNKVLDLTDSTDTRQQAAGRIYIPFDQFKSMFNIQNYPTRQYRIICQSGKEEDIKLKIEKMNDLYYASNIELTNQDYVKYFNKQSKSNQSISFIISIILLLALLMLIYAYCQTRKNEISLLKREGLSNKTIQKYLNKDFTYMSIGWFILTIIWVIIYKFLVLSTMSMSISMYMYIGIAVLMALVMIVLVHLIASLIIKRNIKGVS